VRALVDTNILLRWTDRTSPEHAVCARVIDHLRQSTAICVCAQVLIEFYSVATRPREVNGLGLDATTAQQALADIVEALPCLPEAPDMAQRWREVITVHGVLGKQVHDARLVALMQAHNISNILTLNVNDFTRYQQITPTSPTEVLSQ